MNGIHDMGGMHGFGPVAREENEPVFHAAWEGRVFAMQRATPVPIPGGSRHNIEQMDPIHYLTSSYYEKWLHSRIKGLIDAGVLTQEELAARTAYYRDNPTASVPRRTDPERVQQVLTSLRTHRSPFRDVAIRPQFRIDDAVRVRNLHPPAHTRLPRYVRGKRGVVRRFYGIFDLQDTMPPGVEPPPQPVYAVRFEASELWGEAAEAHSVVYIDMWESYLELAG
jgi:nitrile hydratase beta subunit